MRSIAEVLCDRLCPSVHTSDLVAASLSTSASRIAVKPTHLYGFHAGCCAITKVTAEEVASVDGIWVGIAGSASHSTGPHGEILQTEVGRLVGIDQVIVSRWVGTCYKVLQVSCAVLHSDSPSITLEKHLPHLLYGGISLVASLDTAGPRDTVTTTTLHRAVNNLGGKKYIKQLLELSEVHILPKFQHPHCVWLSFLAG